MISHRAVWISRSILAVCLSLGMSTTFAPVVRAATPEQVAQAIEKGKTALWAAAKAHGGIWDDRAAPANAAPGLPSQWGGTTALCTYALLATGENRDDPRFKAPTEFLIKAQSMTGIYAIGMRANVWPFLNTRSPEIRDAIGRDYKLLHSSVRAASDLPRVKAFYRYTVASNDYDHSASQYGVLGMWAIESVGGQVPDEYWRAVEAGWRKHQSSDGGWGYIFGDKPESTGPMTAAGVATLFITQDYLHSSEGINCPGNITDAYLDKGLAWIGKHFDQFGSVGAVNYGWYGIERIGVASGYKYFGAKDWYAVGADNLVTRQLPTGLWPGDGPGISDAANTAFALLFLSRGRAPVAINKLQYTIDPHGDKPVLAHWNQRPRDAAHLVKYMARQMERDLNWQIVNLDAPVQDLHDAPLLYLAGNQVVALHDADYDKLRQYVQEGGVIVGNSDCNNADFTQSFQRLGKTLFPAYPWIEMPTDHVVYAEQFPRDKWKDKPSIKIVSNGSRVLMVQLPAEGATGDFARHWQAAADGGHEEALQFMDDLFIYAVDRGEKGGMQNKGETYVVRKKDNVPSTQSVKVARLKYDGNWDPEPAGWSRLGAILHNEKKTSFDLNVQPVSLGDGSLLSGGFKVAHLTGTEAVKLSAEATSELTRFITGGGTLIVDACGGAGAFATSMEGQLSALVPNGAMDAVPPGDRIFGKPFPMKEVDYRRFARRTLGNLHSPRMKGIQLSGRTAVYYSAEDLSTGLVGQQVDGIIGYAPASATSLMANLLSSYVKLPSTGPATTRATSMPASGPVAKPVEPKKG